MGEVFQPAKVFDAHRGMSMKYYEWVPGHYVSRPWFDEGSLMKFTEHLLIKMDCYYSCDSNTYRVKRPHVFTCLFSESFEPCEVVLLGNFLVKVFPSSVWCLLFVFALYLSKIRFPTSFIRWKSSRVRKTLDSSSIFSKKILLVWAHSFFCRRIIVFSRL